MNFNISEKIKDIDIFHPYILIFGIIAFIFLSIPILYFSNELEVPTINLFYCITIGIIFFIIGTKTPKFIPKFIFKFSKNKRIRNFSFIIQEKIRSLKNIKLKKLNNLPIFSKYSKLEIVFTLITLIGIILQIINLILLNGIPLFSGILKADAATKIWLFSYIFFIIGINILLANFNRKSHYFLLIIGLFLFILTGYRTTPIAILLSVFITLYYTRYIKIKYQIIFFLTIAILLIIIGFVAVQSIEWQQWRLNPIELISYRAGFTLNILDKVTYLSGSTNGSLLYYTFTGFFESIDPRVLVGESVLGNNHSITSTIFGPAILDFGWIAMILQMFIMGFILKIIYYIQKYNKGIMTAFYAIILAQTIIWIETGPTDLVVWIFYLIAMILGIYYLYKYYLYSTSSSNLKIKIKENFFND